MKLMDWIDRQPARIGFGQRPGGGWGAAAAPGTFNSRAEIAATSIADPALTHLRTAGFGTPGDGGAALYVRAAAEPAHPGKVRSADGTWWELVPGPEGTNVRAFGAVGDGAADDSQAIADAWQFGWARRTEELGGLRLHFPPGEYLVTRNNVLGNPGVTGQRRWMTISGTGQGAATLRFRPATGTSAHGDNRYYLFDGGTGASDNPFTPQFIQVRDLLIRLEDDDLAPGDELWFWRMNGDNAAQSLVAADCDFRGPGPMSLGHVRTGILDIVGGVNGSENELSRCNIRKVSHIVRSTNPQAVMNVFNECHPFDIHDHFFVIDGGSLEYVIHGGSWLWADVPDVSPHYLFDIRPATDPGTGSCRASIFGFKPEMRSAGAALVSAPGSAGVVFIGFLGINFAGGGIEQDPVRAVTSLHEKKVVTFHDCHVPTTFAFDFVAANSALGAVKWDRPSMGLVLLRDCALNGDLSANVTRAGAAGRVVALGCFDVAGAAEAHATPRDFDSNPFNGGTADPAPVTKTVSAIPEQSLWSDGKTYQVTLPHGARLRRVSCYRPPAGDATVRTLTLADGNGTIATVAGAENAGLEIDHVFGPAEFMTPRTAPGQRTLSLSLDAAGGAVAGGLFLVEWI